MPALAHRLVLRPSSGCSGGRARTSCASCSTRCRRRPTEDAGRRVTRSADAAARRLRGARRGRARRGARAPARRARRRSPRRSRCSSRSGSAPTRAATPRVARRSTAERALEGDVLDATLDVRAPTASTALELASSLPAGARGRRRRRTPVALHLARGEERELPLRLRCTPLGLGGASATSASAPATASGSSAGRGGSTAAGRCAIYPPPGAAAPGLAPAHTQAVTGSEVARVRAEGLEFADTRPFVAGDRLRSVNWRATRTPRRASSSTSVTPSATPTSSCSSTASPRRGPADEGTLEQAVRAAATLASRFLERRDRVGLVTFGGILRWLEPGGGLAQHYRLVDALLETGVEFSYAWKDVNVIPARTLPPTRARDRRHAAARRALGAALLDLRGRGHDLVVLEVSPEPYVEPGAERGDALALRALAAAARGAARALRAPRRRRRDAGRRDPARGGAGGGEGIPASRPARAALAAGAAAVAVVARRSAGWLALVASDDAAPPVLVVGRWRERSAAGLALRRPVAARPRARRSRRRVRACCSRSTTHRSTRVPRRVAARAARGRRARRLGARARGDDARRAGQRVAPAGAGRRRGIGRVVLVVGAARGRRPRAASRGSRSRRSARVAALAARGRARPDRCATVRRARTPTERRLGRRPRVPRRRRDRAAAAWRRRAAAAARAAAPASSPARAPARARAAVDLLGEDRLLRLAGEQPLELVLVDRLALDQDRRELVQLVHVLAQHAASPCRAPPRSRGGSRRRSPSRSPRSSRARRPSRARGTACRGSGRARAGRASRSSRSA